MAGQRVAYGCVEARQRQKLTMLCAQTGRQRGAVQGLTSPQIGGSVPEQYDSATTWPKSLTNLLLTGSLSLVSTLLSQPCRLNSFE